MDYLLTYRQSGTVDSFKAKLKTSFVLQMLLLIYCD